MLTLIQVFGTITNLLEETGRKKGTVTFQKLAENEIKTAKANMFYEILNLSKQGRVEISQRKPFGEMEITVL